MAIETRISNAQYERLALDEPDQTWELWDGQLREKPAMTFPHNDASNELGYLLRSQLDRSEFRVRVDSGRVHRPGATYFVPDVFVVPVAYITPTLREGSTLEVYNQPLPLVVEVWSRSTGDYDVTEKLAAYKARGDAEIWFLHPYQRTLTSWVRQPDGTYEERIYREGLVSPVALPGVVIDLGVLFDV
jgi:Uma2 family endonuclease